MISRLSFIAYICKNKQKQTNKQTTRSGSRSKRQRTKRRERREKAHLLGGGGDGIDAEVDVEKGRAEDAVFDGSDGLAVDVCCENVSRCPDHDLCALDQTLGVDLVPELRQGLCCVGLHLSVRC